MEQDLTARRKSYVSYIIKYPLYSTLLVLKEYEELGMFEECAIIRDAIEDYSIEHKSKLPDNMIIPTHVSIYNSPAHQKTMTRLNLTVDEKVAKQKATLIKLNLPVK